MKYVIASDLHGSVVYTKKLAEAFEREKGGLLILLGDIYYHGPRNPLPEGYDPKGVAEILNAMADRARRAQRQLRLAGRYADLRFRFIEDMLVSVGRKNGFF